MTATSSNRPLEMPPLLTWFSGRADVVRFFAAAPVFAAPGQLRLVPVRANGQPAFAAYQRGRTGRTALTR